MKILTIKKIEKLDINSQRHDIEIKDNHKLESVQVSLVNHMNFLMLMS
jgi:hypothetical protein